MDRVACGKTAIMLAVGLLLAGCGSVERRAAEPPEVLATFPFDPNTRWILVPVTFEGEQYGFILDTGSTDTIFDLSFRDRLGRRFLWPKKGTAADGKPFTLEFFHAPEAFVGPLKINDGSLICVADLSGVGSDSQVKVHGILGMDFLRDYAVRIDGDRASVSFLRSQKGVTCPQWGDEVPIRHRPFSSVPYVEGQVDGIEVTFLVDTGAVGILSGRLERRIFEKVRSETPALTYHSQGRTVAQTAAPRTGSIVLPDRLCLDGLVHEGTAFSDGRRSIVSLPFFSGHIVTFDFPNNRLYLKPARNREPWGGGAFGLGNLGFTLCRRDGGLSVSSVNGDGIAHRKDIREGDFLLEIDGQDVSGLTPIELLRFLMQRDKNNSGDGVTLTFRRGDVVRRVFFARPDPASKEHATN